MEKYSFECGVSDYVHLPYTVDITFPITKTGQAVIACQYCKLFTGHRCTLTKEVIFEPQKYVGYDCPIKKEEV